MANKKDNEEVDVLAIGEVYKKQEEKLKPVEKKKTNKLPVFMMILGILLMAVGCFYKDISSMFVNKENVKNVTKSKEEIQKEKKELLECSKTNTDKSLGIDTIISYSFHFKNMKLIKSEERRVIKASENSDIGSDNITVISNNYDAKVAKFSSVTGIEVYDTASKNKYVINIDIDYNKIDVKTVPQDDSIRVINNLDDEYKKVQEIMITKEHALCE